MPVFVAGIDVHKKVLMVVVRQGSRQDAGEVRRKCIDTRSGMRELAS